MQLRPYQSKAVSLLHRYFRNNRGNPVLEAPTGSGKSMIQAAFIRDAVTEWPQTRVLALCHVKELVEQNAKAMRRAMPGGDIGVMSAGLGSYDAHNAVIFGGIQTVAKRREMMGRFDLIFVDEAHLVPKSKSDGQYRQTIDFFRSQNPKLKVIGFTATPYRLDGGLLHTGENRLFTDLIAAKSAGMSVAQLVEQGYLSPLTTKPVQTKFSAEGIAKSGGDYIQKQLSDAVAAGDFTQDAVAEMVQLGVDRQSWLVFATDVLHAYNIQGYLRTHNIESDVVTGETPPATRDRLVRNFREGRSRCLINVSVLTTGFDAPQTDLVAFMRPTASTSLYVQMCGRGMRIAEGKTNCLVLDFVDNIAEHGPVDNVKPNLKRGEKGEAPLKECHQCNALVNAAVRECPECGAAFEIEERGFRVSDKPSAAAIMSADEQATTYTFKPTQVKASVHRKPGKPDSVKIDWYAGMMRVCSEWVCPSHGGYAKRVADLWWMQHMSSFQPVLPQQWVEVLNQGIEKMPSAIVIDRRGKYPQIISREHKQEDSHAALEGQRPVERQAHA